jgi:hypothetical protein
MYYEHHTTDTLHKQKAGFLCVTAGDAYVETSRPTRIYPARFSLCATEDNEIQDVGR